MPVQDEARLVAVRLAVPAVVAADRRLDDALAVFSWREPKEAPVARMRRFGDHGRVGRNRLPRVARDGVADERAQFLIRDFH